MDGSEQDVQGFEDQFEERKDARSEDEQVVEIGWQILLIPLVILVVAGGYYAGRMLRGEEASPAQTSASDQELVQAVNDLGSMQVPSNPGAAGLPGAQEAPVVITIDPNQLGGNAPQVVPPSNHPLIGQTAPDFTMSDLFSDEAVALSDLRGQPVLINFWATWCPPCRYEMPWLESVYKKYGGSFELLAVDAGEKVPPDQVTARVQQYVERMGLTFPVLMGDNTYAVQQSFGVYGLPATFIVDGEGTVVAHHGGMYPSEAALEAQLLDHIETVDTQADG